MSRQKLFKRMKDKIRKMTSRVGGRSMKMVASDLRRYLTGWKEYFRLADTPNAFRVLDGWVRHRLRAVQLKQWKCGTTAYEKLRARGITRMTPESSPHIWGTGGKHPSVG